MHFRPISDQNILDEGYKKNYTIPFFEAPVEYMGLRFLPLYYFLRGWVCAPQKIVKWKEPQSPINKYIIEALVESMGSEVPSTVLFSEGRSPEEISTVEGTEGP